MIRLSKEDFQRASHYIHNFARPLDRALFEYLFENGSSDSVVAELSAFQNDDGGFGHSIEPDFRLERSSPLATTVGLQFARELRLTSESPLVRNAVAYLLSSYDQEKQTWSAVPKDVNDVPHAPWWNYDVEKGHCGAAHSWANPGAEIVGYLHEYKELVPTDFLASVTDLALQELEGMPNSIEMHDFFCYMRLMEVSPEPQRGAIFQRLSASVRSIAILDPSKLGGYGAKPIQIATSPASPFYDLLRDELPPNLDYEIERFRAEGSWNPTWSWFGQYDEAWKLAEQDWKGFITVSTLKTLRDFGRIEGL